MTNITYTIRQASIKKSVLEKTVGKGISCWEITASDMIRWPEETELIKVWDTVMGWEYEHMTFKVLLEDEKLFVYLPHRTSKQTRERLRDKIGEITFTIVR